MKTLLSRPIPHTLHHERPFLATARIRKSLAAIITAAAMTSATHAAVLLGWNFNTFVQNDTSIPGPIAADIQEPGTAISDLSLGQGLRWFLARQSPNDIDGSSGLDGSMGMRFVNNVRSNSQTAALNGNVYASFTLAPAPGYMLNVTSLTLDAFAPGTRARNFFVRSSTDSFVNDFTALIPATSATNSGESAIGNINLTNLTQAIEFRIYTYAPLDTNSADRALNFDNITVNGTVAAIPEPAAMSLLGMGVVGMLTRRRRSPKPQA